MESLLDSLNANFTLIHLILLAIGVSSNGALLLAAFLRTPRTLKSYSVMIKVGTLNDLIAVFCDFYTMQRMIVIPGNLLYLSEGPCAMISGRSCYLAYCLQMCTETYTMYVLAASFTCRLWILNRSSPKSRNVLFVLAVLYIPPAIMGVSFTFAQAEDSIVQEFLRKNAPQYLSEPGALTGHSGMTRHLFLTLLFCVLNPGLAYTVTMIARSKILRKLSSLEQAMSERTRRMHESLVKALTVHALLPLISGIGAGLYLVLLFDVYRHAAIEKSVYLFGTLPSAIAAFSSLYYVEPYRKFIISKCQRSSRKVSNSAVQDAVNNGKMRSTTM